MNQAFRIFTALLLLCAAQIVLGITAFNEHHVFANPGILDSKASNLSEWLTVAKSHSDALFAAISPLNSFHLSLSLICVALFCAPALAIALWPDSRKFQGAVLLLLTLMLAIDVNNLLSFNGYNSANGGYDGLDDLMCYALHMLAGAACIALMAGRWLWAGAGTLRRRRDALDRQ